MSKREKTELLPTLKINPKKDDDLAIKFDKDLEGIQVSIVKIEDRNTNSFGEKVVATVEDTKTNKKYSVFVNGVSMNNLIEAFGQEDSRWTGKLCTLNKEQDKKFKNDMIVFHPVK